MKTNKHHINHDELRNLLAAGTHPVEASAEELHKIELVVNSLDDYQAVQHIDTAQAWNKITSRVEECKTKTQKLTVNSGRQPSRKLLTAGNLRIAAAILVLFCAYPLYRYFAKPQAVNIETTTLACNGTEPERVVLQDGTVVMLYKGSQITFPNTFQPGLREVSLTGEAFFDVKRDETRPFRIKAAKATVEVLGTSFSVNNNAQQDRVEVIVSSGKVRLSGIDLNNNVLLTAGMSGQCNSGQKVAAQHNADLNQIAWKTKKLEFKNSNIAYVQAVFEKTYQRKLLLSSKEIENLQLTATFEQLPDEQVVEIIANTLGLSVSHLNNDFVLNIEKK
jgi:ferric-dicitrate binding protein FerR (iron transport regulator)